MTDETGRAASQIYSTMERARVAQSQYWSEDVTPGGATSSTEHELKSVLLDYWKIMKQFSGEDAVEDRWEESGLDRFGEWATEKVEVETSSSGFGRGNDTIEIRRIRTMDPERADALIDELHEIAHKVGFRPETDAKVKETSITKDQINEAIEKIESKT